MTLSTRVCGAALLAAPILLSASLAAQTTARPHLATLDRTYDRLAQELSGDSALRTVAFVEQFWRQPGSVGFDTTIAYVAGILERAGYVEERGAAADAPLVYRIEHRPMAQQSWSPVDASLSIEGGPALLRFATNRNMLAINSWPTPDTGVVAPVVNLATLTPDQLDQVAGKVVFAEGSAVRQVAAALQHGAIGALIYRMPAYTQPEVNRTSIQFGSFHGDSARGTWQIFLSYAARTTLDSALAAGPVRVRVRAQVDRHPADELTLVAEARGTTAPAERFVFSAHVQEPGANDNATGVGTQAEMARVLAAMIRRGDVRLGRTVTFLWGDEIRAVARFLAEDSVRTRGVDWGLSLDMVGEDTRKTGGTFLIEKMPDPSAVWTRGDDHHTEWGGSPLTVDQLTPHWYNDFVIRRCEDVAARTPGGWTVRANPFEGGSDHTPFLDAHKPGLLMWHFTDQFYHTDNDRLDMVSAAEMQHAGVCALAVAIPLATADQATARFIVADTRAAALDRLAREAVLSRDSIAHGGDRTEQRRIVETWRDWYLAALGAAVTVPIGGADPALLAEIEHARDDLRRTTGNFLERM